HVRFGGGRSWETNQPFLPIEVFVHSAIANIFLALEFCHCYNVWGLILPKNSQDPSLFSSERRRWMIEGL
ncbi:MAG: hypothetical protein QMD66_07270, partial [Actinomycetota bacterium]|nr:hypothetical protein [Actinomycetota bacterium]